MRKSESEDEVVNVAASHFFASMAHETRTPLHGILGFAELLAAEDLQEDERAEYARTILESGRSLLGVVNGILDFAELLAMEEHGGHTGAEYARTMLASGQAVSAVLKDLLHFAELLAMEHADRQDRAEYIRRVLESGQALLVVLEDLLELAGDEAGKLELELAACDPVQLFREVSALFSGNDQGKELVVMERWNGAHGQRYWLAPARLRQRLSGLIGNAITFSEAASIRIDVAECLRVGDHAVLEFSVTDHRAGIDAGAQEPLLGSQADRSALGSAYVAATGDTTVSTVTNAGTAAQTYADTGQSLSIARNLAQLMGGEVGVQRTEGGGLRLWFAIRARVAQQHEAD